MKRKDRKKRIKEIRIGNTALWAILLMFLTTVLTSTAQTLYKLGIADLHFNIISIITNWPIILGLCIYAIGAGIMIIALKGGEVSVLYPIIATSYLWVSIISMIFFKEPMNALKWSGIATIMIGVSLIGLGSRKKTKLGGVI